MRKTIFIIVFCAFKNLNAQKTNLAPSVSASDEYFGTIITDEYRNLENLQDSATIKWMKSQTSYAVSQLNKIPKKNYYLDKRLAFDAQQHYSVSDLNITNNDKYFYLKRNAGEKTAKIYYREGFNGAEKLLYDPADYKKNNDSDFVINLISPSWDGNRLAISLTENGKEISEVIVMEVNNKYVHPEIITNTDPSNIGEIKWLDDNSGFFYVYFPVIDPNSSLYNRNTESVIYKIGKSPKERTSVLSNNNNPSLKIKSEEYPAILSFYPNNKFYIGILVDSEDYRDTFIIRKDDLLKGGKNWKPLYSKSEKIHNIRLEGDTLYFLSGNNSPNQKLCKTNILKPNFANPEILIPERKDEVITQYVLTKEGLYYSTTKNGVEAKLYFYNNGKEKLIKLPYTSGNIYLTSKGSEFSDLWVSCSGWTSDEQRFRYNLTSNSFIPENLAPVIKYTEFKDIVAEEITVKSYDGTEVPLSLIYNKNTIKKDGLNPVFINGYGAYAESYSPYFSIGYLLWANQGGIVAVPHVRGGGEKGEQWHIDGQKLNKPNSWKDLISCTEYLINQKYTSPKKVAIFSGSAGGILVGRAITERPDLFGAAIITAGVLNAVRIDKNGTGGTSIQEYGNPRDSLEFKGLLEMDAYLHLKKGIKYPATLITTGINDPRVMPWMSSKFAAKMQADNSSENPILLKIDYNGGHGGDIPIKQAYSNIGDIYTFAFWQLGHPDYQPKNNKN